MRYAFSTFRRLLERSVVPVFCCAAGISLAAMTGCASSGAKVLAPDKKAPDPILGEVHPTPAPAYGPAAPLSDRQKQVPGTSASRPVDDPLFPSMPTSNAYLAGRPQRLPGSETLAIGSGTEPGAFQLTGGSVPNVRPVPLDPNYRGQWTATGSPPNTTPAPTTSTVVASATGGSPTAVPNNFVDPDTALLQSRGVSDQHVEKLADGTVRVTAIVPHKDDPTHQTSYEAVGKDFPTAAQLIVQKIDQNR
jgi:hypothetical protein